MTIVGWTNFFVLFYYFFFLCVKTNAYIINAEEDDTKSPSLSPAASPKMTIVSKPLFDSGNDVVEPAAVKNTSVAEEETPPPPVALVNGKSSPQVNGIAPVRHETGSNKNLTVEIDIPPGKRYTRYLIPEYQLHTYSCIR